MLANFHYRQSTLPSSPLLCIQKEPFSLPFTDTLPPPPSHLPDNDAAFTLPVTSITLHRLTPQPSDTSPPSPPLCGTTFSLRRFSPSHPPRRPAMQAPRRRGCITNIRYRVTGARDGDTDHTSGH
ncbi:hypothetical protein E2C01_065079 [Portunus trituberculatus]|uniref:Uncharacterized protein n=1 Tax=Portunus trituberculatus TaxID=210409 RepID=A0A5B7HM21_PORTR|nr:hypothetical protein [Portunus trituberculatus]